MALTIDEINKMDNEVSSLLAPFGVNTNDDEEFEYEMVDDVINNADNQNSLSDDEFNEMEQAVNASLYSDNKNINDLTAKNKELFYFEDETNSKALDSMVEIPDETLALYGLKKDTSFIKNYFTQEQWEEWQNKGKIGVQEAWNRKKKYEMIPFVGTSMDTGLSVKNLITFNRLKNGESVRPEDEEELKKYILEMAEIEARGGYTFGGGTLDIITGSIPYMLEFGAGLATVPAEGVGLGLLSKTFSTLSAKKAASTAVKKGVKGAIAKEVVKQMPKVVTSSAKFGVTKMPQHFIGSIADKQLDTGIYITPVGDTIFTDSENIALSIMKALGETTFETMSETSGFMFAPIAKYISKPVRNLLPKTFYTNFDKLIKTKFGKSSSEVLKKYGYDGVLEEMGEELLNRFLCQTFGINGLESYTLDGFLNNVFYANDHSKWGQEALSFALTSGGAHSLMAGSAKLKGSVEKYYMQQGYIRTKGSESLAQQELRKMLQKNNVDESVINNYFATHTEDDFRQALYTFKSSEISSELDKKEFELEEQSNQVKDNVFKLLVEKGFDEEQADSYSRLFKARSKMVAKNWGDVNAIDWLNNLGLQIDNEQQKTLADGSPVRADSVSYEQSAMYASKAKNFDEFYNKVLSSDKNIKSKEQYNLKTKGNNYFRIPFDTVLHDKNGHSLTKEQWNEFLENIDNPIDFEISSKPRFAGKPILLKVKTNSAYYGAVIETFEKNNPIITTVFKDTEKNIDNWLKKERPSQTRNTSAVTTKGLLLSKGLTNIITNVQPNYNPNVKYNEQYLRSENIGSEVSKINISQLMNGNKPQSLTDINTIPQQTGNLNPNVTNLEENIKKNFNDSVENIIEYVKADILNILQENDISEDEFSLQDIKIYGSYAKGKNKDTSDLDIIVQYTGVMSEDGAFNILNDEKLTIQDVNGRTVEIDINPVNVEKSGTIDENLKYFDNLENNTFYQSAYHGTPHKFDEFSTDNIGTGEGAQAHGWGLYFAENKDVSENYRKKLAQAPKGIHPLYKQLYINGGKANAIKYVQDNLNTLKQAFNNAKTENEKKEYSENIKNLEKQIDIIEKFEADNLGQLFEVDIPENDVLLDEDKTIEEQSPQVKKAIQKYFNNATEDKLKQVLDFLGIKTGKDFYNNVASNAFDKYENGGSYNDIVLSAMDNLGKYKYELASKILNQLGIKGITYDGRQDGRCYVVFDDKAISVLQTFYQEGKNVVDLTSDFEKTPTIDEVKTYINQIVENGTKFATLSPDWFIDIKQNKRNKNKILNAGNYKKLNATQQKRHSKYILSLEKLLANAQYIGEKDNTKKDKKPNVAKYHYFKTNVKIGDKVYELIFDTEEHINENQFSLGHENRDFNGAKTDTNSIAQNNENFNDTEEYINDKSLSSANGLRSVKNLDKDTNSITENNNGFNPKTVHLYNITELKKTKYYQNNNDFTQNIFGEKKVNIDSKEAYDNFIDNFSSEETRAAITFENNALNSPKAIIHLFENADKSSFLHEVGHLFLQDIINAAKTNEYAKRELEAINKMLGHTQGEYTRAEHEKFAKGFEIYLMNGKAPNAGLKSAFDTFKSWLREIYNFVLASNGALSQDVYSVYDSLFKDYNPDDMEVVHSIVRNALHTSNNAIEGRKSSYLTKTQKRYKETAYDILTKALGKNKTYLKNILENKATKKNAKAREKIENKIANISDEISSSDGMLPEWKEFFADNNIGDNSETKSDYELVQKAYDVIVNKSYQDYDEGSDYNYYSREIDPDIFEKYEKAYNYILDIYRNGNEKQKDYAVAAMYDWLDSCLIGELYEEIFTEMFEQDFQELERIANLDKFGKAKEKISNAAKMLSYSDTKNFNKLVIETLKSLDFLTSKDKTIILSNLMQYKTTEEIRNNLDEIMDIAKILDSQNYFNRVETKIQKALEGTKNVKQGNKTVGKYTKEINDVFADLRRFNNMTQERAAQELETMNMFEGEETDSLSFEDKLRHKFLYYKATPNMYISSDFISDLYKDILTLKNYGYLKKEQDKFMRKVNIDSKIEKLLRVLDKKKKGGKLIKKYIQWFSNWESALNAIFNNDIKEEYSLLDKEAEVQVWQNQQKQEFLNEAMKIFGVKQYKFDNLMIDKLAEKFTFIEYGAKRTHKIEMNKMDIILAYIWSKNPNLKERLERQFTQQGLYDMFSNLDNEEIEFANLLQKTASKFYNEANKVYIQKYGIELPRVQNYFPSKTERTSVVDLLADFSFQSAASPSFIKNRVVSNMPTMKFSNPLTLLFSHIDKMGVFIKMTETIDLYNKVFTDTDIKKTITELYGKETYESFATTLANSSYQKQAVKSDGLTKIFNTMVNNFVSSKIILKPSIMIKQLFSTVNYAENMPVTTWCSGFLKAVSNPKATIDFMMSDEYLKTRFTTGGQNEYLKQVIENSQFAKTRKLIDYLSLNVKIGDIGAIIFGGKPYIDYLMNVKGMTKEAAFKEFRLSTMRSQQASMASSLSNFQNNFNNPFVRGLFSFRNTPNQYFRKVADSIISYANGDTSKSQMAKTIFIYTFVNAFMYNTATSLSLLAFALNGGGDDDDLKQDIIKSFFDFNSQAVPILGDLYTYVLERIMGASRKGDVSIPAITDIFDAIQNLTAEDVTLEDWINELATIADITTGLPVQTTVNMAGGVGDIAQGNVASGALRTVGYTKKRSQKTTGEED